MPSSFIKAPAEELNYGIDWSQWLEAGDTITASTWAVPVDLSSSGEAVVSGTETVVTLTGGVLGGGGGAAGYTITNEVTTAAGLVGVRSITIRVQNR